MTAISDLTGRRFGKLVVVSLHPARSEVGGAIWLCRCDCGGEALVKSRNLGKNTNSCGCMRYTQGKKAAGHPLYKRWQEMIARCDNPADPAHKWYGARGITVCERWRSFPNFLADLEATHFPGASLDRVNNDGNYEPANVRWATKVQQARNMRTNKLITHNGKTQPVAAWAEERGLPARALALRLRSGWNVRLAIETPLMRGKERWAGRPKF